MTFTFPALQVLGSRYNFKRYLIKDTTNSESNPESTYPSNMNIISSSYVSLHSLFSQVMSCHCVVPLPLSLSFLRPTITHCMPQLRPCSSVQKRRRYMRLGLIHNFPVFLFRSAIPHSTETEYPLHRGVYPPSHLSQYCQCCSSCH